MGMAIDKLRDKSRYKLGNKLENNEVHVWQASLHSFSMAFQHDQLFQFLTEDERSRADRYVQANDRIRFIIARGLVRVLLGRYLDINPAHIIFEYGPHGKPILASNLQFNISHAGDRVACIFTRGRPVGIDIERIRDNLDIEAIAERFFSASEFLALQRLGTAERLTAFFNIWARKEAFIKSMGLGLFYSLQQFDVSAEPESAAVLAIQGDKQKAQNWFLQAFTPAEGYVGAFAIESAIAGREEQIHYYLAEREILCA
jgi:4'-phosphopantetheinyl transferase